MGETLELKQTTQFKKDLRRMVKRGADMNLLDEVISLLLERKQLPDKYRDHPLSGDWAGYRDCHVLLDWLLIYMINDDALILTATRTGTHSDIFQR
ncbi:MAG: type II toxin-antitoxin system YafQ family toxin [Methylobacteriaceae bacterium]|nr:type II toxin-antitoxin system YafQ family toxin [Methylobacteriaceae bacterium]